MIASAYHLFSSDLVTVSHRNQLPLLVTGYRGLIALSIATPAHIKFRLQGKCQHPQAWCIVTINILKLFLFISFKRFKCYITARRTFKRKFSDHKVRSTFDLMCKLHVYIDSNKDRFF